MNDTIESMCDPVPVPTQLKPNDILVCRWGYSMIIVDFYQVVRLSPTMATVRKLKSKSEAREGGHCSGYASAIPNEFADTKVIRRKFSKDGSIRLTDYSFAKPWDGNPVYYDHND